MPAAKTIAEHRSNPDFADGVWAVVDVDVSRFEGRAEKINITLPRHLLAKIDSYAKAHGLTRSGFLAEAARAGGHAANRVKPSMAVGAFVPPGRCSFVGCADARKRTVRERCASHALGGILCSPSPSGRGLG